MPRNPEYEAYIQSEKWKAFAMDAKLATGLRCQGCDRETPHLHVHHLTYERLGNERSSDVWVVCPSCHLKFHPHHKKRVNKIRKKQGKRKVRGLLGVPKGFRAPKPIKKPPAIRLSPKHRGKDKVRKGWTDEERERLVAEAAKKLGPPKAMKDFRTTLLGRK